MDQIGLLTKEPEPAKRRRASKFKQGDCVEFKPTDTMKPAQAEQIAALPFPIRDGIKAFPRRLNQKIEVIASFRCGARRVVHLKTPWRDDPIAVWASVLQPDGRQKRKERAERKAKRRNPHLSLVPPCQE